MKEVEILYNILTQDELEYIYSLINNKSNWVWRTNFDELNDKGEKLWYDSILPDYDKLTEYHKFICENDKYVVGETAINIISKDRQTKNNFHYDSSDLSFATYFGGDFKGGRLFYYNNKKEKFVIEPKKEITVKINTGVFHSVEEVYEGTRFSLYTFLKYNPKKIKTLL